MKSLKQPPWLSANWSWVGVGAFTAGGDVAQAANLTFNTNADGVDDTGAMAALQGQTLGDSANNGMVTINTNGENVHVFSAFTFIFFFPSTINYSFVT